MMATSRRTFLHSAAALGGAVALGGVRPGPIRGQDIPRAGRPLNILILGGTGFIGPHQVRYALARGHRITLFNRGRTNPGLFPDVEQLVGDRDSDISALEGTRRWDAVIDNHPSIPRWVRMTAQLLADRADHYMFVSSLSVYSDFTIRGLDENGPLETVDDPTTEEVGRYYGALKALCEAEARRAFPGKATNVRPGLIVGPGDPTGRFTYWPVRIDRGGEVLSPGDGSDPVQVIDARDLSEWMVRVVEERTFGTYNANGPASPMRMDEMLYGIKAATTAEVSFTWADAAWLATQGVNAWRQMPAWVPGEGEMAGFGRFDCSAAIGKGLTFRPLAVTARDTIDWFGSLPEDRQNFRGNGLDPEREAEVLAAWHARGSR